MKGNGQEISFATFVFLSLPECYFSPLRPLQLHALCTQMHDALHMDNYANQA